MNSPELTRSKDDMQGSAIKVKTSVLRQSGEYITINDDLDAHKSGSYQLKNEPSVTAHKDKPDYNIVNLNQIRIRAAKAQNDNFRPNRMLGKKAKKSRDSSLETLKQGVSFTQLFMERKEEQHQLTVPQSLRPYRKSLQGRTAIFNAAQSQKNINVHMPRYSARNTETTQQINSQRLSKPNLHEESFKTFEKPVTHIIEVDSSPKPIHRKQVPDTNLPANLYTLAGKKDTEQSKNDYTIHTKNTDPSLQGIDKNAVTLTTHQSHKSD